MHIYLIAATGLVLLLKIGFKLSIFQPVWPWWMTLKNNRAPHLYYVKHSASFHGHHWIQTGVALRKRSIRVKISNFFVPCDLQMWQMTLKNNEAPVLYYIKLCASFQSHGRIQTGVTARRCSVRIKICDFFLEIWRMTLKNNKAPLLCHCKLCELFHSHQWILTGVTVRKRTVLIKLGVFFVPYDLKIWRMTWKTISTPSMLLQALCIIL